MKLTVREVSDSFRALETLMHTKIPASLGFDLARAYQALVPEYNAFALINEPKVREYGKRTPDGGMRVDPASSNFPKYIEEMAPVFAKECEIECKKIKLSDLTMDIEPMTLVKLAWLIES